MEVLILSIDSRTHTTHCCHLPFLLQVCNPTDGSKGVSLSMTNVHSQTNGQQSQACSVTPSASKHGSIGLDDLSAGSKKRGGGGSGGKDTMTQISDTSLTECSTATSVLSQTWGARSPTAEEKAGEERAKVGVASSTSGTLPKPKRKPAPSKPGSACSNASAAAAAASASRPPSSASSSAASCVPLDNLNTNRNNSTSLNQSPPPPPPPFVPSPFSGPLATPSPAPSVRYRETPVLRRAPRTPAKYQTLPTEDEGRSRARRRYSLSEGGASKTRSVPRVGRVTRSKRSQSMSGMLLPKDGDSDTDKGRCESDWILESTV